MSRTTHWRYEVVPDGKRGYRARQYMNDQLLKSTWRDTEWEAQDLCKEWAANRPEGTGP